MSVAKREIFDCAQVLAVMAEDITSAYADEVDKLIRTKQFWHVVVVGREAQQLVRILRSRPGMPNFLQAQDVQDADALLEMKNITPHTLAVMHGKDTGNAFAQQYPQAKIFDVVVEKRDLEER